MPQERAKPQGTYLLLARLNSSAQISVGKLGTYDFAAGWYTYAGSALGPGGLEARLARHARSRKRLHWHIDYLLGRAALEKIWAAIYPDRLECTWAAAMHSLPESQTPVPGFGASDCRCVSHLTCFLRRPTDTQIVGALARHSPTGVTIGSFSPPPA